MNVVGVDGCRGGWIAMCWDLETGTIEPGTHASLAGLIDHHAAAGAIGIDIPIGLSDTGTRRCDVEARRLLGRKRASSVFPPPIRELFGSTSHAQASSLSRSLIGKGISIQTYSILDKVEEANDTVTPEIQDRVFEVHPEVSFCALAGRPMMHRKNRQRGYDERKAQLEWATGMTIPARKDAFRLAPPAKPDDILDAIVAAWTARRVVDGLAGRLPEVPETDSRGLRMEIVF